MPKQIGMLFVLFMGLEIPLWSWMTRSVLDFSIELSLNRHIKQFIASEFQGWHKALCYDYENVKFLEETNLLHGTPFGLLLMV
jgi:hypothetical protein